MSKSLYQILIDLSESHCRFKSKGRKKSGYADLLRFDLENKSISNGNIVIMSNGELAVDKIELTDGRVFDLHDIELIKEDDVPQLLDYRNHYDVIEDLYHIYKTSVPSQHSTFSKQNFKALKADDLSMKELIHNMQRIKAQYMLEAYILLSSLKGWIPWQNDSHFFWQSTNDRDLVLFKNWIKEM